MSACIHIDALYMLCGSRKHRPKVCFAVNLGLVHTHHSHVYTMMQASSLTSTSPACLLDDVRESYCHVTCLVLVIRQQKALQ